MIRRKTRRCLGRTGVAPRFIHCITELQSGMYPSFIIWAVRLLDLLIMNSALSWSSCLLSLSLATPCS